MAHLAGNVSGFQCTVEPATFPDVVAVRLCLIPPKTA